MAALKKELKRANKREEQPNVQPQPVNEPLATEMGPRSSHQRTPSSGNQVPLISAAVGLVATNQSQQIGNAEPRDEYQPPSQPDSEPNLPLDYAAVNEPYFRPAGPQITSQDTENMLETMLGNLIDSPEQQQQQPQPGKTIAELIVTAGQPDENGACFFKAVEAVQSIKE